VKPNLNPMGRASRRERKFAKLGTRTPCCYMCGETDPDCLQLDHPTSRKRDPDFTVILCANCHCKETYKREDAGIPMCREHTEEELTRMRLLAVAAFQESSAEVMRKWAASIERKNG
jgi:hypothetical protein